MPTLLPLTQSWPSRIHWHGAPVSWNSIVATVLIITALTAFYYTLNQYAINVPITDDFHATLQFILRYQDPAIHRFDLLISQHNEHRIVVSRLLALLQFTLFDEVNFRQLLLWQSLFLPALLAAIGWLFRQCGVRLGPARLLPLVLLLFSLDTWETYLFVSGGSQSYPTLLSMVLTLICLHQAGQRIGLGRAAWLLAGACCATVATFSFGCGMFIWPGGLLLLYLQRRWRDGSLWFCLMAVMLFAYLRDFQPTQLSQNPVVIFQKNIGVFLRFVVSFPGASFQVPWDNPTLWRFNLVLCYGIGLACWLYFGHLTLTGYARQQPLIYSFITLFFAVDLLIAFSRCRIGSNTAFNSRYQILSAMILIGLYLALLQRANVREQRFIPLASWCLILLSGLSAIYQPQRLAALNEQKISGLRQWKSQGNPTLTVPPQLQQEAGNILKKSWARIYKPEPDLISLSGALNANLPHQYTLPSAPVHPVSRH